MPFRRTALAVASTLLFAACADPGRIAAPTAPLTRAPSFDFGDPCDPRIQVCDDPGGGAPPPPPQLGISLGISQQYCQVATPGTLPDADGDGLNDTCEYMLAVAFAPLLVQGIEVEAGWPASSTLPTIPGEYLFAVGKGNAGYAARIAYLPAYYKDRGAVTYAGEGSHSGDSEFIMVDLAYNTQTGRWYTARVFLSAHCGAYDPILQVIPVGPNCHWYGPDDFAYVDGVRWGAPVVWVADWKHANYTSSSACQSGIRNIDTCNFGWRAYRRFPIGPTSEILPVPNTDWIYRRALRATAPLVDPNKTEMFANTFYRPFTGWQANAWGEPASPYGAILARFGIIPNGGGAAGPECNNIEVC